MSACTDDYWSPLESLLGPDRCVGFMFMGRLSNGINQYKHGISRRYLFLDDDGVAYERVHDAGFRRIALSEAIARIEEPLREIGETLETPYDSEYISRKDAALRAAGFEVLRFHTSPGGSARSALSWKIGRRCGKLGPKEFGVGFRTASNGSDSLGHIPNRSFSGRRV